MHPPGRAPGSGSIVAGVLAPRDLGAMWSLQVRRGTHGAHSHPNPPTPSVCGCAQRSYPRTGTGVRRQTRSRVGDAREETTRVGADRLPPRAYAERPAEHGPPGYRDARSRGVAAARWDERVSRRSEAPQRRHEKCAARAERRAGQLEWSPTWRSPAHPRRSPRSRGPLSGKTRPTTCQSCPDHSLSRSPLRL